MNVIRIGLTTKLGRVEKEGLFTATCGAPIAVEPRAPQPQSMESGGQSKHAAKAELNGEVVTADKAPDLQEQLENKRKARIEQAQLESKRQVRAEEEREQRAREHEWFGREQRMEVEGKAVPDAKRQQIAKDQLEKVLREAAPVCEQEPITRIRELQTEIKQEPPSIEQLARSEAARKAEQARQEEQERLDQQEEERRPYAARHPKKVLRPIVGFVVIAAIGAILLGVLAITVGEKPHWLLFSVILIMIAWVGWLLYTTSKDPKE